MNLKNGEPVRASQSNGMASERVQVILVQIVCWHCLVVAMKQGPKLDRLVVKKDVIKFRSDDPSMDTHIPYHYTSDPGSSQFHSHERPPRCMP